MKGSADYLSLASARRRRRFLFGMAVAFVIFCAVLMAGAWVAARSPLLRFQELTITGNNILSEADVISLLRAGVLRGPWWKRALSWRSMLIWPDELDPEIIALKPAVKKIAIFKDYFRRSIRVEVTEREPVGIWCFEGAETAGGSLRIDADSLCWWFDREGMIFGKGVSAVGSLIVTVKDYSQVGAGLYSSVLPKKFMPNFLSVLSVLKVSPFSWREMIVKDLSLEEIEVIPNAGPKFYFSLRFPADAALGAIEHLYGQPGFKNFEYVDFRVENKVYYR